MKREEYESQTALKVLRFLERLIHQPKEWISGAKLKLSEMKFPGSVFFIFILFNHFGVFFGTYRNSNDIYALL
jgi:hypothetical protein